MSTAQNGALAQPGRGSKRQVVAWAMWDWGTQPFQTVITTFVFSVYLTSPAFGETNFTSQSLSLSTALAGLLVALLAPVLGQNSDRTGHTVRNLRWLTWALAVISGLLFFVRPHPNYLWLGLIMLGVGSIIAEIANVNYYSLIDRVATPANVGRVSGFGWGMGYLGGIVVLLLLYFAFIQPQVGLFGVSNADGLDIRVSMLGCALWTVVFTLPTFLALRDEPRPAAPRIGVARSYALLWDSIKRLWRTQRNTAYFLIASALFRDGLSGVFTFGAVIAAGTFGFTGAQVIVFGAAANIIAGLATIASGWLDDRFGPKRVIIGSLGALVALCVAIFALHDRGPQVFWVCGLLLCAFVGPAQSASRSFLARLIPEGQSGEIFGLYATTGRAVSFLAPSAFGLAIGLGALVTGQANTQYWGILGIVAVLLLGALAMLGVKDVRGTH
ncbi:MFS transporter [Nigerium massiliense]|uniref:MFS transporter n=1 Tax=Nigerium massiliense TaxID=1522317 RepID=UPI00058BA6CE|nr:MFS transporter [Nigerium massiliense]